ncbi:hypothetical protein H0O00_03075 [Candidatus Micrarchaeota archaeon]|nr:hypothetical protein [Candidatus Micrarchaeota archaeon]
MRIIADLHVHSKYARATSPRCDIPGLAEGARMKGINVMASGDFTHPAYLNEMKSAFAGARDEQGAGLFSHGGISFILSTEVCVIFELNGKSRKMHHVLLVPSLEVAEQINDRLAKYGDLKADGRPTLMLSSAALAEEVFAISQDIMLIPAHCLLPGTQVHCNPHLKSIEELRKGDTVYTHIGRRRKVTETYKRPYKGEIFRIVPWYFSLGVETTSEHPIYAIKTVKNCSWTKGLVCKPTISHLRVCYQHFYKQYVPQWVLARDMEKGDVLVYPRFNDMTKDIEKINIRDTVPEAVKDFRINVNEDFCRLVGYYLAEGHSNGRDAIGFTFNTTEREYIEDVKRIMEAHFGVKCKSGKTSGELIFYSKDLMNIFESVFYSSKEKKRAFTKCLPDWAVHLPLKKQVQIIRGWWRGDKGSTSSKLLANQIKIICLRLGIVPGIRIDRKTDHKIRGKHIIGGREIIAAHDNFIFNTLTFFEDPFNLLKESEFNEFDYKTDIKHGWIDENYVYLPVRKIERFLYEGDVYNIEVKEDNSYLTEFAAVHNCWTPWFSIFGSKAGVDSVEEAFEDQAHRIHALETGLSSDPAMNWMLSSLDRHSLVSNSDAHSLGKLGREANVFELEQVTYRSITEAIKTRKGFVKTYEFYPEEGKYHYDGHRNCKVLLSPTEAKDINNICPVCRRKLTIGVLHRVSDLADRRLGFKPENAVPFQYTVPLETVISKAIRKPETSQLVADEYSKLIRYFGNEFAVYEASEAQVRLATSKEIADALVRVNTGKVRWVPGYDGVFGELLLDEEAATKKGKSVDKKQKSLGDF